MTIIINTRTELAMGRMNLSDSFGWVDPAFASTFANSEDAVSAAKMAFGARTALIDCVTKHI